MKTYTIDDDELLSRIDHLIFPIVEMIDWIRSIEVEGQTLIVRHTELPSGDGKLHSTTVTTQDLLESLQFLTRTEFWGDSLCPDLTKWLAVDADIVLSQAVFGMLTEGQYLNEDAEEIELQLKSLMNVQLTFF